MYWFKLDRKAVTLNLRIASEVIGIDRNWLCQILNKRKRCSKMTAYCITKYLNEDAEISDYFVREEY